MRDSTSDMRPARWVRAALQVNPYPYVGKGAPSTLYGDESTYNDALLESCLANNIEIIAVTDHWNAESADTLLRAASDRGICALPGFEANTAEGIHLLVIFEVGTRLADVTAAIGACGVTPNCSNGTTGAAFSDIMTDMTKRGALVIPAHVNVPNSGMLTSRSGPPLQAMIRHPDLHALGITPSIAPAKDQEEITARRKPFDRQYPLSVLYADDVNGPSALQTKGASSWFKVSKPCLAGLKHAVRIPATRVSTTDPASTIRMTLCSISWLGGFLDGQTINFADDLTTLIGGRGTGKSAVVESLRYVLDIPPIGQHARTDHSSIVQDVLQRGTTIRLVVNAVSPAPTQFVIQRVVGDPPTVFDAAGVRTTLKPLDVVGVVETYSQHELAEVAEDATSVAKLVNKFAGPAIGNAERASVCSRLTGNRQAIAQARRDRAQLENELGDIPRLQDAISQFQSSDVPGQLAEQERLTKDQAVFLEGLNRVGLAERAVSTLHTSGLAAQLAQDYQDVSGSTQVESLTVVAAATQALAAVIVQSLDLMDTALTQAKTAIAGAQVVWQSAIEPVRDAHAEVTRSLIAAGHDPARYLATSAALSDLLAKQPRLSGLEEQIKDYYSDRNRLIGELDALDRAERERLNNAIRAANAVTDGRVLVKPVVSADRRELIECVEAHVQNQRAPLIKVVERPDFSPKSFVVAAREGRLTEDYGIGGAQLSAIEAAGELFLLAFEEISISRAVDISLDISVVAGVRNFRHLQQLSKGQKATALLLLLLGAATGPLIIDQPEDDLDNRFIYDHVVTRLQALKGERQLIVSTHNANVPVLGDAELVVTLEGDGQHGWPSPEGTGSLDKPEVRQMAERLLEGGRDAFDARKHLYGL